MRARPDTAAHGKGNYRQGDKETKKLTLTVLLSCLAFAPCSVFAAKLDINTASAEEREDLSGAGPAKAEAIVEYRKANGPFASVEDLALVSGIGDKALEHLRSDITSISAGLQ